MPKGTRLEPLESAQAGWSLAHNWRALAPALRFQHVARSHGLVIRCARRSHVHLRDHPAPRFVPSSDIDIGYPPVTPEIGVGSANDELGATGSWISEYV